MQRVTDAASKSQIFQKRGIQARRRDLASRQQRVNQLTVLNVQVVTHNLIVHTICGSTHQRGHVRSMFGAKHWRVPLDKFDCALQRLCRFAPMATNSVRRARMLLTSSADDSTFGFLSIASDVDVVVVVLVVVVVFVVDEVSSNSRLMPAVEDIVFQLKKTLTLFKRTMATFTKKVISEGTGENVSSTDGWF
jgi:hypothetical protein